MIHGICSLLCPLFFIDRNKSGFIILSAQIIIGNVISPGLDFIAQLLFFEITKFIKLQAKIVQHNDIGKEIINSNLTSRVLFYSSSLLKLVSYYYSNSLIICTCSSTSVVSKWIYTQLFLNARVDVNIMKRG